MTVSTRLARQPVDRMLGDLIGDGNRAIMENSVDGSKSLN